MTVDLVQRLRTCSAEERRAVAIEVSKIGTDEAIDELINMGDGECRIPPVYGRKQWYSFSKTLLTRGEYYNFDDQLIAVDALGETKSRRALEYLRELIETRHNDKMISSYYQELEDARQAAQCATGGAWCEISYHPPESPNIKPGRAKYELKARLEKEEPSVIQRIQMSIQKLESTFQNAPLNP